MLVGSLCLLCLNRFLFCFAGFFFYQEAPSSCCLLANCSNEQVRERGEKERKKEREREREGERERERELALRFTARPHQSHQRAYNNSLVA